MRGKSYQGQHVRELPEIIEPTSEEDVRCCSDKFCGGTVLAFFAFIFIIAGLHHIKDVLLA